MAQARDQQHRVPLAGEGAMQAQGGAVAVPATPWSMAQPSSPARGAVVATPVPQMVPRNRVVAAPLTLAVLAAGP